MKSSGNGRAALIEKVGGEMTMIDPDVFVASKSSFEDGLEMDCMSGDEQSDKLADDGDFEAGGKGRAFAMETRGTTDGSAGSGDLLNHYFRDMKKIPLLTAERETEIAKKMERSERELRKIVFASPFAAGEVIEAYLQGNDAVDERRPGVVTALTALVEKDRTLRARLDGLKDGAREKRDKLTTKRRCVASDIKDLMKHIHAERRITYRVIYRMECNLKRAVMLKGRIRLSREALERKAEQLGLEKTARKKFVREGNCAGITGRDSMEGKALIKNICLDTAKLEEIEKTTGLSIKRLETQYERVRKAELRVKTKRDEMVQANLRLVVRLARRYMGRGLGLSDLIQEGNIGLMKAVSRFEYRRGLKFSTYAVWWVRQALQRAIADKARMIRIPVYRNEVIHKAKKLSSEMNMKDGREPTLKDLAANIGLPESMIGGILDSSREPLSLDAPVWDDNETTLIHTIEDTKEFSTSHRVMGSILAEKAKDILYSLSPREEKILRMRFGIGVEYSYTLEEIGRILDVTRERVRQIEARALRKLRTRARDRNLMELVEN